MQTALQTAILRLRWVVLVGTQRLQALVNHRGLLLQKWRVGRGQRIVAEHVWRQQVVIAARILNVAHLVDKLMCSFSSSCNLAISNLTGDILICATELSLNLQKLVRVKASHTLIDFI